jgi:hypothetical protein
MVLEGSFINTRNGVGRESIAIVTILTSNPRQRTFQRIIMTVQIITIRGTTRTIVNFGGKVLKSLRNPERESMPLTTAQAIKASVVRLRILSFSFLLYFYLNHPKITSATKLSNVIE